MAAHQKTISKDVLNAKWAHAGHLKREERTNKDRVPRNMVA